MLHFLNRWIGQYIGPDFEFLAVIQMFIWNFTHVCKMYTKASNPKEKLSMYGPAISIWILFNNNKNDFKPCDVCKIGGQIYFRK